MKQYDVQIAEQYNQYENKDIIAPFDGIVKSVEIEKEGAVVAATQVVAEIILDSDVEIVEAEILNSDIGYAEGGQDTDIKVDAYDYQKYGKLYGTVVYVSPDATEIQLSRRVIMVYVFEWLYDTAKVRRLMEICKVGDSNVNYIVIT